MSAEFLENPNFNFVFNDKIPSYQIDFAKIMSTLWPEATLCDVVDSIKNRELARIKKHFKRGRLTAVILGKKFKLDTRMDTIVHQLRSAIMEASTVTSYIDVRFYYKRITCNCFIEREPSCCGGCRIPALDIFSLPRSVFKSAKRLKNAILERGRAEESLFKGLDAVSCFFGEGGNLFPYFGKSNIDIPPLTKNAYICLYTIFPYEQFNEVFEFSLINTANSTAREAMKEGNGEFVYNESNESVDLDAIKFPTFITQLLKGEINQKPHE